MFLFLIFPILIKKIYNLNIKDDSNKSLCLLYATIHNTEKLFSSIWANVFCFHLKYRGLVESFYISQVRWVIKYHLVGSNVTNAIVYLHLHNFCLMQIFLQGGNYQIRRIHRFASTEFCLQQKRFATLNYFSLFDPLLLPGFCISEKSKSDECSVAYSSSFASMAILDP